MQAERSQTVRLWAVRSRSVRTQAARKRIVRLPVNALDHDCCNTIKSCADTF